MSVNNFISFFFSLNACTGLKTVIFINFTVFLEFFVKSTIFVLVLASIAINGLWNRRSGPGGGTRRLHHILWGRHRIDTRGKDRLFARYGSVVIGLTLISVANIRTRREKKVVATNNNRFGFGVVPAAANNDRKVVAARAV